MIYWPGIYFSFFTYSVTYMVAGYQIGDSNEKKIQWTEDARAPSIDMLNSLL